MKSTKTISAMILAVVVLISVFSSSCTKSCDQGYEGTHCVPVNQKFVGTYIGTGLVVDYKNDTISGIDTLVVTTTVAPDSIVITYSNTLFGTLSATASVNGTTFSFNQLVSNTPISGTGTLSGNNLSCSFVGTSTMGQHFSGSFNNTK